MLKKAYFRFNTLLVLVAFLCSTASEMSAAPNFYPFSPVKKEKEKEQDFNPAYYNPIINDRIIVSIFDILEQDAKETKNKKQVQEKKNNTFFSFKKQNENQKPTVTLPKINEDLDKSVLYNQAEKQQTPKEQKNPPSAQEEQTILINFNDVSIIEFLRFISRVSNQNFIFDENDLQFNVTIVSEEPTTIENVLTALYQELRIHNLELIEQGNNMIIHKNPRVNSISRVVTDTLPEVAKQKDTEIVTRVFSLNTLEPDKAATIIRPLTSQQAIIEPVVSPNTLIVTDLVTNIEHISQLLKSLDSPNSGLVIGQYAVTSMTVSNIQRLTQEIMGPIAQGQTLILVPHSTARSIFVIGPPYLVERTLLMMKYVDQSEATTQIHDLEKMRGGSGDQGQWKLDENGNWIFSPATNVLERSAIQNEEILNRLIERLRLRDSLDKDLSPSEQDLLDQLKRKHALKALGRDLSNDEALLMEQIDSQLKTGEMYSALTPEELEILNKLYQALLNGELLRGLTPEEIAILKKLERQFLDGSLDRELTPEEFFFKDKLSDKTRESELEKSSPPRGKWYIDETGKWRFLPEGSSDFGLLSPKTLDRGVAPEGMWEQDLDGKWRFKLAPGERITAKNLSPQREMSEEIPFGTVEGTKFMMHKLQNRQGDEIVYALENIAYSLQSCGNVNQELICTINSVQWIESSNSLIFTGTPTSLEKVKELVKEIDAPARQVFIEMLILETTIDDALTYGVNWASRFGGGDVAGAQAFNTAGNPLTSAMDTTGSNLTPSSVALARQSGFSQGVIGQTLSKDGVLFRSIGALVRAVHNRTDTRIVMNPKLLVEDNQEAEIFVGINTSFKTQSIANEQGRFLTNNIEYRDVGTTLRITPMIGNNDVITLDIFQESSSVLPGQGNTGGGGGGGGGNNNNIANEDIGPTTRVNKTITRVHIPDRYFLVISGMMQDDNTVIRAQVPCLGGVPVIGGLFGERTHNDAKRNLMIFIRPQIIDTVDEIQHLTKHQQDIYKIQDNKTTSWKYGVEEALDFLNIPELCRPCCADDFVPETY